MEVIVNTKLIKRNNKLGSIATFASLGILAVGLVLSFMDKTGNYFYLSFLALILGFVISQVGIYFSNRWGRSPRPDEVLTSSLKGLGDKYTLFNFYGPVSHLLLTPDSAWALLPFSQGGQITFDEKKKRYHQKGGNWYMKLFAQESLGRPDAEANVAVEDVEKFLKKNGIEDVPVNAALVFINPKASVDASNAPYPTTTGEKLKDVIRKSVKDKKTTVAGIQELDQAIRQAIPTTTE
jgi:hypothetical protein